MDSKRENEKEKFFISSKREMIFVIVINLISCVMIVSFCSMNSRKNEREKQEKEEEKKNTLLMISDNFLVGF